MIIKFWGVFGSIARPLIYNDVQQKFKEAASFLFKTDINSFLKHYKLFLLYLNFSFYYFLFFLLNFIFK